MTSGHEAKERAGYRYWQEKGSTWAAEYDRRKESIPLYHVQELMLATYLEHSAPARVLEYGCGVGRHLRYLRELPGIEAYGYDQSPTMVEGLRAWATEAWIAERVLVGQPVGRLPYPDGHFDIVFTAEVLVHVHPEDLDVILAELTRVTRWQLLHLEPPLDYGVDRDAHSGSWTHDLPAAYLRLGHHCEVLAGGYQAHTPYRVAVDSTRPLYTWSPVALALCRRLERDLTHGLGAREARAAEAERLAGEGARAEAAASEERLRQAHSALAEREGLLHAMAVRFDDLERRLRRLTMTQRAFVHQLESVLSPGQ